MYVGIDLGTTNVKTLVVDEDGSIKATGSAGVEQFSTSDGSVEQDIEQIWEAVCAAIGGAVAGIDRRAVRALGVSSQGGALQVLDAQDRPLGRVISWLDGRGRPFDLRLVKELGTDFLAEHIGHGGSTMTLGQVLRIRHESPGMLNWPHRLGFVGDVIVGRLCGRRAHDPTSLGIGMLYNPWLRRPDPQMLVRLGLEEAQLPALIPATAVAGELRPEVARQLGLRAGIPVSPAIHDQYAASLGTAAVSPGEITFGSGTAWVLLATTDRLARPVVDKAFVGHHPIRRLFGQMLSLGNGGSAIDWVMKLLGRTKADTDEVDNLVERVPAGSDGLRIWPLLIPDARSKPALRTGARIERIGRWHKPAHFVRAVVEGLACELTRHLQFLSEGGFDVRRLSMCGSAAGSRTTSQIIADATGLPVDCIELPDVSAFGAAMLAACLAEGAELAETACRWSPASRRMVPGPNFAVYREVLAEYLVPFREPIEVSREGSQETRDRSAAASGVRVASN